MKKIITGILFLGILLIGIIIGFFIINKINVNKRTYKLENISEYKYFVYKEKENFGVIDSDGKVVIEAKYEKVEIPNPSKEVFICYKNDKGVAVDKNDKQLFAEYNSIASIEIKGVSSLHYEKSVLKTEKNGKYGLIDFSGKKILDTEYDSIQGFSNIEGELLIKKNDKVGVANIKGTILVKPEYDTVDEDNYYNEDMIHGYIVGIKNEDGYKYGYINSKGKLLIKIEYNEIYRVTDIQDKEGIYLIASKNGQYGVLRNKKLIINNEYQSIDFDKNNDGFIIQKGKKFGVMNKQGKEIIPVENIKVEVKGQYIYVDNNNIKEVYDANGQKANIEYNQTILPTANENYKITINSEENGNFYGVINSNNSQIIKSEYLYIEYAFGNYFIACGKNGKLGVLDSNGKTILDFKYDVVQKLQKRNNIQTLYSETNTTEIYSEDMKKICEMNNASIENHDEYIKLYSNSELKYIDNNGKEVQASEVLPNNKIFASSKNGKWGYVDKNGKTILNYDYEFAAEINEHGYAAIKKDGKWGSIDSDGKIIVEPKYELNKNNSKIEFIGEYVKVDNELGSEYYTKEL